MRRFVSVVAGAAMLLLSAASADAQAKSKFVYVGVGPTLPMGDYGDYANPGWMVNAGLGYNVTNNFFLGVGGMYGSNGHDEPDGAKTNLPGIGAFAGYSFGTETSRMAPYLRGGLGYLNHQYKADGFDESEWGLMVNAGGGLFFPRGTKGYFIEGIYNTRDGTDFLLINLGATFTLGGGM